MLIEKNPQFSSNQATTQPILPTDEVVILTKVHNDNCGCFTSSIFLEQSHFLHTLEHYYEVLYCGINFNKKMRIFYVDANKNI